MDEVVAMMRRFWPEGSQTEVHVNASTIQYGGSNNHMPKVVEKALRWLAIESLVWID